MGAVSRLASFVVARQPVLTGQYTPNVLFPRIMQPVLVPVDPHGKDKELAAAAQALVDSIPESTAISFSLEAVPTFHELEFGTEIVSFLASHNWRGMLPSDGTSHTLPLLTRLDGGIRAWSGTKGNPKASQGENAAQCAAPSDLPLLLDSSGSCSSSAVEDGSGEGEEGATVESPTKSGMLLSREGSTSSLVTAATATAKGATVAVAMLRRSVSRVLPTTTSDDGCAPPSPLKPPPLHRTLSSKLLGTAPKSRRPTDCKTPRRFDQSKCMAQGHRNSYGSGTPRMSHGSTPRSGVKVRV
uniref:Uncharacterized protein n=1 Tax=Haptolina brevifila TaxID=156173 RepID=A0A7S2D6I9_9EUKA|mmetsp:Transcript_33678/g.67070  ORF Transcript_33678/g.67070 Transcript_33678/m.67070 type:complete len:299 (+) Transcript_33678:554-1450(+)